MYYLDDPNAPTADDTVYLLDNGVVKARYKVHRDARATPDASEQVQHVTAQLFDIEPYRVYASTWATAYAIVEELVNNGIEPHRHP